MIQAAQGLLKVDNPDAKGDPAIVFPAFQKEFVDTELFFDRFVGAKEWGYLQVAHEEGGKARDRDEARRRVEEAQLFIEAAHGCYSRILEAQAAKAAGNGAGVKVP
jgi:sulfite reductase (ferredoxin)